MAENRPNSGQIRIKDRRALIFLLVLLIGLTTGQWLLQRARVVPGETPPWLAFLSIVTAMLVLLIMRQESQRRIPAKRQPAPARSKFTPIWVTFLEQQWQNVALALSLLLTAYVLRKLPAMPDNASYGNVVLVWVMAFVLYALALAPPQARRIDWPVWWRRYRWLVLTVGGILLIAFLLRVWRLETLPSTLSGDEASQGLEAIRVMKGQLRNPFSTGWLGVPTMSFFFNSITMRLLGPTVMALRLPWAFAGTATVLVTFFLVKQLKDTQLALLTAALVATYHYHIHFSRLGSNQVADPLFMALAMLFLYRALDRGRQLDWVLLGAISGLAFYFYTGARLTPVVIFAVLAYVFIREPRYFVQKHGGGIVTALGAFLIVAAPMIQYAIRFPGNFNARLNQVGIIQSGWLAREVEVRGESTAAILFDQFRRAALAFNYYSDRTVWYGLRQPLLDPLFGGLFLLGLGYGTLRLLGREADQRLAPMVAWWWGGMILGGMLTESPPSSQRLITLAIPVCFFIALALWEVAHLASRAIEGLSVNTLLGAGVLLFSLISLTTYFLAFTPQRLYGGTHAELATEIAPFLKELKQDHHFYFVGAPWMYWGFATLPYLVPNAEAKDIPDPITLPVSPTLLPPGKGAVFIFVPERLNELEMAQQTFPQGRRHDFYSPVDGRLMVTLYIVSP